MLRPHAQGSKQSDWTRETLAASAKRFTTETAWHRETRGAYGAHGGPSGCVGCSKGEQRENHAMKRATLAQHQADSDQSSAEAERALRRIAETIEEIDRLVAEDRRGQTAHQQRMQALPGGQLI
jgi:hypothetical protein